MKRHNLIALIALPTAVAAAYGLDLFLLRLFGRYGQGTNYSSSYVFWGPVPADLLYAAALLALFWAGARAASRWVGAVYLIVGITLLLYPASTMTVFVNAPNVIRDNLPYSAAVVDPRRGTTLIGAFVTVSGAWSLIRPASRAPERLHTVIEPLS